MDADVTEFKSTSGKACSASACGHGGKEAAVHSAPLQPDLAQR